MSFDHFHTQRQAIELSSVVSNIITHRIRPLRALSSIPNDPQADEENQHEQNDATAGSSLLGAMSSGENIQHASQDDQEQDEKDGDKAADNALENNEDRDGNPKPDKKAKRQKRCLGIFKDIGSHPPFTLRGQLQFIVQANFLMNLFLFLCPVGFVLQFNRGASKSTFVVNFLSTIPANHLGNLAMTEIGLRVPRLMADWMSISVGNLIQFMSCVVLLKKQEYLVLKTSITGSILANILFFLGLSIFAGCCNRDHQNLNRTAAHMASNLLSLSSTSLLIPTASDLLGQANNQGLARQSRGVAIVLLVVYWCFVLCEQWTHWPTFAKEAKYVKPVKSFWSRYLRSSRTRAPGGKKAGDNAGAKERANPGGEPRSPSTKRPAKDTSGAEQDSVSQNSEGEREHVEARLHFLTAILLLACGSTLLYFHVEYVVESLEEVIKSLNLTKTFIGLIVFPLANCDYAPILLATDGKLAQTITQTVGKSIQTALLVMPSIVCLAWIWHIDEVTLVFNGFEVISLFAAVLLLNLLLMEARLHWIQGILLLADWCLIAIAAYFANYEP